MVKKICSSCKSEKGLTSFSPLDTMNKPGKLRSRCKICEAIRQKEARKKERKFKNRIGNLPRERWTENTYILDKYERARLKRIHYSYGLNADTYFSLLNKQNYCCAICRTPEESAVNKRLSVDHCHDTGKIRGLLCNRCNLALGSFKDEILYLESAIKYLKDSK